MRFYSNKELKEMDDVIKVRWRKFDIPKLGIRKMIFVDEEHQLAVGDRLIVSVKGVFLPFLGDEELLSCFSKIKIDVGAIKFITNGANLMRPGIKEFSGGFVKDDVVVVQDEKHGKSIAVGLALMDLSEAEKMEKGAIVRNLHYVGDEIWKTFKSLDADVLAL